MVTRCAACGGEIKEGQRYCTFCGTPAPGSEFGGSGAADRGFGGAFGKDPAADPYLRQQALTPSWATLAGAGRRVAAYVIDTLILTAVSGAIFGIGAGALGIHEGVIGALLVVASFAYFIALEGKRGQTLGKQTLGIKVVRQVDGRQITIGQAAARNLLRVIDALPFWNLLGFLLIIFQAQKQRVGDLAAKTVVIDER